MGRDCAALARSRVRRLLPSQSTGTTHHCEDGTFGPARVATVVLYYEPRLGSNPVRKRQLGDGHLRRRGPFGPHRHRSRTSAHGQPRPQKLPAKL